MSQNYSGRVTLIIVVLLFGLFGIPGLQDGIFSLPKMFDSSVPWREKHNLKPGIDIAGGTSLLYEIKQPPGGTRVPDGQLADRVATLLKKRVDPTGTRNLIWRPMGDTRLEIQLPRTSANTEGAGKAKAAYLQVKAELENTNVLSAQVLNAVEGQAGDARRDQLNKLATGHPQREALFAQLASLFDKLKDLDRQLEEAKKAGKDLDQLALDRAEVKANYEAAKGRIDQTNISVADLEALLDSQSPEKARQLGELKARYPERTAVIDRFAGAYPSFVAAKGAIDGAADLKRLLRGSGVLEFRILVNNPQAEMPDMVKRLEPGGDGPAPQAGDNARWFVVDKPADWSRPAFRWRDIPYALAWTTADKSMTHVEGGGDWGLQDANLSRDQNGKFIVNFAFDNAGGALFSQLTGNNVGQQLATILDNRIITAPNINEQIGDRGQISLGSANARETEREGNYIASTLSAGSLPAQLADEPISEREVGPQLGESNLKAGLFSCIAGLLIVAVFMTLYYHVSGLVAIFALAVNLVIILGVLAMMGATFTLPGIAALVLTIGVSVDANVLIFERLREEQVRGLSIKLAIRNAYDRAFTAILDSNVTTAITSAFLIYFGSEEVKGFGLTLLVGILASMFSALFVTRTIFGIMIDKYGLRDLGSLPRTYPRWNDLMHPKIDWMGKVKYFAMFSTAFVIVGIGSLVHYAKQGKVLDVEFAAGTEVTFVTRRPMSDTEVRDLIAKRAVEIPQPAVVAVGDEVEKDKYTTFSIVTANDDRKQVSEAVFDVMGPHLNVAVPSSFDKSKAAADEATQAGLILPIEIKANKFLVNGQDLSEAASQFPGGVAIVLNNIDPPLKPEEIHARASGGILGSGDPGLFPRMGVTRLDGRPQDMTSPAKSAVVMISNPRFDYAKSAADWREKLANPAWRVVTEGVGKPANFQKVSNFDPQVAGDTQRDAIFATLGSIVAVMVWIWLRFGDVKYGTATVFAMIHDTALVVGAIGWAHLLAGNAIGAALLVEPFRVNMTIVAAILTVMGYSMVDTIVVFDRIRENRGKYGTISRQLINDSINQTLSRTLLTAGTTLVTLFVMYIWGGPAIHGFTFILFIGIIIGTYSSIAIAAPFLLLGSNKPAAGQQRPASRANAEQVTGAVQKVGA